MDRTFNWIHNSAQGGIAYPPMWPSSAAYAMAVQSDGRIILAGSTDSSIALVRYNADGSWDPSFGGDGSITTTLNGNASAVAIALQPDGKILVAGGLLIIEPYSSSFLVARYNTDGSLDDTFDQDGLRIMSIGVTACMARAIALDADGHIVLAGWCYQPGGQPLHEEMAVIRLRPDGSFDPSFDGDGMRTIWFGTNCTAMSVAVLPDGNILVGGSTVDGGSNWDFGLAKLQPNGALDPSFGNGGTLATGHPVSDETGSALVVQPDGRILQGGTTGGGVNYEDMVLVRYEPDGSLDASFGGGIVQTSYGLWYTDIGDALCLQPDGRIVFGGSGGYGPMMYTHFLLARFNADGTPDVDFNGGIFQSQVLGSPAIVKALALAPDGALLAAGLSNSFMLARYVEAGPTSVGNGPTVAANMVLFPNPVSDRCVLEFDMDTAGHADIRLVDGLGRTVKVFDQASARSAGHQRVDLNLSFIASGSYLLTVQYGHVRSTLPLLKQ